MARVKLGNVAKECRQNWSGDTKNVPVVGLEHLIPGDVTLSKWDDSSDNTFTKKFEKGQVLLGRRRVYLKKAVLAPFDGICSGDITVIEALPDIILPELLPFIIQNDRFFDYAEQGSAGSLSPRVKWEHLKDYEFELPGLSEQKKLSDELWAAYRLKQSYQALIVATDELVKSRFIEMQKTSDCQNELGDFIERCIPERCGDRELPVLSVTKENAMVHQSERFEATIVSRDKSNYIVAPRGYLVQGIHIDESNFGIQNLVDEGIVSPAYKLWRFKNQDCIPELIEYYLRSEMAIKYFKRHFLGSTVPRRQVIKKDDFLSMPINLPGKSIQESYFAFFKQADKSKFELKQAIEKIDKVMRALLQ